jgi:hypothetical protein
MSCLAEILDTEIERIVNAGVDAWNAEVERQDRLGTADMREVLKASAAAMQADFFGLILRECFIKPAVEQMIADGVKPGS